LSTALQAKNVSACEGQELARLVVKTLEGLRNEENFDLMWSKCTRFAHENGVEEYGTAKETEGTKAFSSGVRRTTSSLGPENILPGAILRSFGRLHHMHPSSLQY